MQNLDPGRRARVLIQLLLGGRSAPRQACRRRRQFQRSPRSQDEEHPSITSANRKFCLISVRSRSSSARLPTICLTPLQHAYKITNTTAWIPKPEPGHSKSRPLIILVPISRRPVRPAAPHDGRGPAHQQLHQYAGRCHHSHRTDYQ